MESTTQGSVRRLVRKKSQPLYMAGDGWTRNPSDAMSFSDALEAARTCASRDITDVDLALCVPETNTEIFSTSLR